MSTQLRVSASICLVLFALFLASGEAAVSFQRSSYTATIDEELPVGARIIQLQAFNNGFPVGPGQGTYSVESGQDAAYFQVS